VSLPDVAIRRPIITVVPSGFPKHANQVFGSTLTSPT